MAGTIETGSDFFFLCRI